MAIGREDGTDFFKLPIMVEILAANHSYDDPPNQTVFQLLTTENVKDGANWFYIPYNVASSSVTKVSPSLVSAMNPAPSFRIWGTSLFNNILICDSARACLSCTPSLVGEGFIDCTLAAAIPAGNYSLYLSDTPNYPAPNIVIQSTASITAISPNRMYIYGGAEMRLEGVNLFIEDPSRIRVKLNIGSNSFYLPYVRYLPVKEYGEDFVTFTAPDFSTGIPNARFMEVNLVFDDGMEDSSLFCNPACSVKILSGESVPAITSFYPIQGQAPLLITVSGHGFTMLPASPDKEDSYIDVGSGLCRIVEMLNTELVCQLETPCANNYANSSLHIFSKPSDGRRRLRPPRGCSFCVPCRCGPSPRRGALPREGSGLPSTAKGSPPWWSLCRCIWPVWSATLLLPPLIRLSASRARRRVAAPWKGRWS
ncbi:hypothetical protein AGDE_16002 [Angomonas deanei]|nr:hypothetical protein AGDE_16002 [Angomonas deanei]|eukprot:EPY17934.1 hypothetical protein AGDE_16002 [Angomonas deanei]